MLQVWSPDPALGLVAALGLAVSVGTSLVVDLENKGRPGERSLTSILAEGPHLDELSPGRTGVACLPGGHIGSADAVKLIHRLKERWPAVVVRCGAPWADIPSVPVVPLVPGRLVPQPPIDHAVWQPVGGMSTRPPGPGPVLPRLRSSLFRRLMDGRQPGRSRWISAWRPVWEMPWE